jgi:hypothetical protein
MVIPVVRRGASFTQTRPVPHSLHRTSRTSGACTWLVAVNRLVRTRAICAKLQQDPRADSASNHAGAPATEETATFGPVSSGGEFEQSAARHGSRHGRSSRSIAHRLTKSLRASATIAT